MKTQLILEYERRMSLLEYQEWKYEYRRLMQEIIPGLFLGPFIAAKDFTNLKNNGITHILILRDLQESKMIREMYPNEFIYHSITCSDSPMENLIPHFPGAREFIDSCLKHCGKILVHCNGGISRSPSICIAYLMESQGMNFQSAYALVQNKRFCINPNEGFKYQLKEYEPIFLAKRQVSFEASLMKNDSKRPFTPDD